MRNGLGSDLLLRLAAQRVLARRVGDLSKSVPGLDQYLPKAYRESLCLSCSQYDYCLVAFCTGTEERVDVTDAITSVTPREIVSISRCSSNCGVICKRACILILRLDG